MGKVFLIEFMILLTRSLKDERTVKDEGFTEVKLRWSFGLKEKKTHTF